MKLNKIMYEAINLFKNYLDQKNIIYSQQFATCIYIEDYKFDVSLKVVDSFIVATFELYDEIYHDIYIYERKVKYTNYTFNQEEQIIWRIFLYLKELLEVLKNE